MNNIDFECRFCGIEFTCPPDFKEKVMDAHLETCQAKEPTPLIEQAHRHLDAFTSINERLSQLNDTLPVPRG